MFENVIGQEKATQTIGSMLKMDRLPHALLFVGPYGVGKTETAFELARLLLCKNGPLSGCTDCDSCKRAAKLEHPDLQVLFPFSAEPQGADKRDNWVDDLGGIRQKLGSEPYAPLQYDKNRGIVVGLAREANERLLESSFEGGRKVCVILHADRMNAVTANTMLKILEEPPAGVHFILTTERLSSVLPTVTSRASVTRFRRLTVDEIVRYLEEKHGLSHELSESYGTLAEGSMKVAKSFALESKNDVRTRATDLYGSIATCMQHELVGHLFPFMRSRDIEEAEELIEGFAFCTRSVLHSKFGIQRYNSTQPGVAGQLYASTDIGSLDKLTTHLEDGLEMLGRNVNIATVMSSLFYGINDAYRNR